MFARLIRLAAIALLMVVGLQSTASAAPRQASYLYEIRAVHSGKCLDIRSASLVDQAVLQQFTCHGSDNQRWLITELSDRSVVIKAVHSGKCLDVRGASLDDGVLVQQFTCTGGTNQRWWVYFGADGTMTIVSVLSGKCLDIRGASLEDRAVAQQFSCHGGTNQKFKGTFLGGS